MSQATLGIASNVFVRLDRNHYVLLDLHKNVYSCIARDLLAPIVHEVLCVDAAHRDVNEAASDRGSLSTSVAELLAAGILMPLGDGGKPFQEDASPMPTSQLVNAHDVAKLSNAPRYLLSFLRACTWADAVLRYRSMKQIVDAVSKRRRRHIADHGELDLDRLRRIVASFLQLRPLYPRDYLCLFDSLSLVRFLAFHGMYPTWVFGVCSDPFAAHCWVQLSQTVLNDTPARVSTYKPIMAV